MLYPAELRDPTMCLLTFDRVNGEGGCADVRAIPPQHLRLLVAI